MFKLLMLMFVLVPILEIYLLIQVGGVIGVLPTIFLVVFTAVFGGLLLRWQGFATLERVRATLARGQVPALELLEGAMLLVGGALLLTPGFFTDAIGFVCLIPVLRRGVIRWAIRRGVVIGGVGRGGGTAPGGTYDPGPKTIDGEYWRDEDKR